MVQGEMDRGAAVLEEIHDVGIAASSLHGTVHEEENQIHFSDGLAGTLDQSLPQQVVGFVDPRSIHKNQLGLRKRQDPSQTAAGCLGDG